MGGGGAPNVCVGVGILAIGREALMKLTNDEGASAKLRGPQHLNNEMGRIMREISGRAKILGGR
jgi:hypothetical protein